MKKTLIVLMVCINLALLAALVTVNLDRAEAQPVRGERNYLTATARDATGREALWILDMKGRRLAAFTFEPTTRRLTAYGGGRNLVNDFAARR